MHNNFYFLRQISTRLQQRLVGFTMVSCFSQNKDEIVIEFNNAAESFFIRGDLSSSFSCITFPESFHRARKNSIDLFDPAILKKVTAVRQFANERSFAIVLEGDVCVLFKMHGNMSNVLLVESGKVTSIFKNSLVQDFKIDIHTLDRHIAFTEEQFRAHIDQPEKLYFTFGKPVWRYLDANGFATAAADEKFAMILRVIALLEQPSYYIVRHDKIQLLLMENGHVVEHTTDPFIAVNAFYQRHASEGALVQLKHKVTSKLRSDVAQTKSWIAKTGAKIEELKSGDHYKAWGDLLMANLHLVVPESESITVNDFYDPTKMVTIKLDPQLSAQKNAERFYRKGKNQLIELTKLSEGFEARARDLVRLEGELSRAEAATTIKTLQELSAGWEVKNGLGSVASVPYREFEYKGFRIWVGKDAKSNDELTLKYSYKDDLWLHVRDDTGSHVLIKYQAGKVFPKDVIERAASLAAFFSKRKTEALCAVVVTPKKFVRKRKGDPAGAVVVEREEVILVEPKG